MQPQNIAKDFKKCPKLRNFAKYGHTCPYILTDFIHTSFT